MTRPSPSPAPVPVPARPTAVAPAAPVAPAAHPAPTVAFAPQPVVFPAVGVPASSAPSRAQGRQFAFTGGAATYFGTAVLGLLLTVCTIGIAYPFALVLRERWRAKHSYIEGRQLVFNGSAWGLFGLWWKWLLLMFVTLGVYGFWVGPRIYRWKWEHASWATQLSTTAVAMHVGYPAQPITAQHYTA